MTDVQSLDMPDRLLVLLLVSGPVDEMCESAAAKSHSAGANLFVAETKAMQRNPAHSLRFVLYCLQSSKYV